MHITEISQKNWLDARNYDLCLNTSVLGWDNAIDIAEKCVQIKLQKSKFMG